MEMVKFEETCPADQWLSPDDECLTAVTFGGECSYDEECALTNPNFICPDDRCGERYCPATTAGNHEFRLAGGDAACRTGRVEVRPLGGDVWGQVCDDDWGNVDATVFCRSIGLTSGEAILGSRHWYVTGAVFRMDNVQCTGDENHLLECPYNGWNEHNCADSEVASVTCS
ncbi:putative DMBT1-like protein [Amphibalanus amphitrite]|uniref:Putative DMBT1-like protein n=1 Tax=Amphibalanus amphitrite TaxID=1232801 RepID=A0A6A4V7Z1_AMPAM|nr:putative DMBT1-like protein [Amphibalanus amphitrite]